jgi:hypothetical protein
MMTSLSNAARIRERGGPRRERIDELRDARHEAQRMATNGARSRGVRLVRAAGCARLAAVTDETARGAFLATVDPVQRMGAALGAFLAREEQGCRYDRNARGAREA